MRRSALVLLLLLATLPSHAEMLRSEAVGLRFSVPREWTRVPAPSDVRAAQWRIPRAAGDPEDGELVLFFFGKAKGGSAEENLDRWYGQFAQPDGRPSRDAAVVTIRTVNGLRVTAVDLAGTYRGGPPSGGQAGTAKPGTRMLAAVIEGEDGPWFFKAIGPAGTIVAAKGGFDALLASLEPHR
jgi:hypothetical protein